MSDDFLLNYESASRFSLDFLWSKPSSVEEELMFDISENAYIGIELMIQRDSNANNASPQLFYLSNCVPPRHNPAKFALIKLKSEDASC